MSLPPVAFHFNVADPIDYVCRLVRKVRHRGMRLVVCAHEEALALIDQRLWLLPQPLFLAHASPDAPAWVVSRSPVRLCAALDHQAPADVLVNLRPEMPAHGGRFARLVEVVPLDEPLRAAARQRWKAYVAQGVAPERHDVAALPSD